MAAVLNQTAIDLSEKLNADGCALSRLIGQLLIDVASHSPTGRRIDLGRSFLLSDYPLTEEVIERREPRTVRTGDAEADPSEVALLRELEVDSLLMLPLEVDGECWGLVELYRAGDHAFEADEVALAQRLVTEVGRRLGGVDEATPE